MRSSLVPLLLAADLAIATPACGGNSCYPILVSSQLKDIAKEFCSYYLGYPKTTTRTTTGTITVTKSCTFTPSTIKQTATVAVTVPATTTATVTGAGPLVTSTVTTTVTLAPLKKRDPRPYWSPPRGAGNGYKLPQLNLFAPSIISSACSCIATPSTTTVTSPAKSSATATVPNTCTQTLITTTDATVTNTATTTVSQTVTVPGGPTTTIVTTTVTVDQPAPTCTYPENDQRGVRGILKPDNAGLYYSETGVADAAQCYTNVKNLLMPWSNQNANLQSYTFESTPNPGSPDGPGTCKGYRTRSCENLLPNAAGTAYGGDTSLAF